MRIIDKIKDVIGGDPHAETSQAADAPEDTYLGTQLSTTGVVLEPSTLESESAMRDAGAADVQSVSKPVEVELYPEARHDDDGVRKP